MVRFQAYEQFVRKRMEQSAHHLLEIATENTHKRDDELNILKSTLSENNSTDGDCICPEENSRNETYVLQQKSMESPKLYLELRGKRSLLAVESSQRFPLTFNCVQSLILQALIGRKAPRLPGWCNLLRRNFIPQVTVIIVHGLSTAELSALLKMLGNSVDQSGKGEPPCKKMKKNLDKDDLATENRLDLTELMKQCLPNSFGLFPLQLVVESPSQNSNDPAVTSPSQNSHDPAVASSQNSHDPAVASPSQNSHDPAVASTSQNSHDPAVASSQNSHDPAVASPSQNSHDPAGTSSQNSHDPAVESPSQSSYDLAVESPSQRCNNPVEKPHSQQSDDPILKLFSDIPMSTNVVENLMKTYKTLPAASKQNVIDELSLQDVSLKPPKEKIEPVEEHHGDRMNRLDLLLSVQEMATFGYPLQLEGTLSDNDLQFVSLHEDYDKATPQSPMYGVDCEMCLTTEKSELTRVSVVDEHLNVIYSSFVKPPNRIIDYLTPLSGVTPDHLLEVTTSLTDVQNELRKILPKDCILVGHSLDSDLHALKLFHPYVIDTARIYSLTGKRHRPSKLKYLAKLYLKKDIQTCNIYGHDPSEDAAASLELVLLKLRNGKSFGDVIKRGTIPVSLGEQIRARITVNNESRLRRFSSKYTGKEYKSNVFKIIKMENCLSTIITTEKHSGRSFKGADKTIRVDDASEVFTKDVPAETKLIIRHCTVFDKKIKKLAKKLKMIDENIKRVHESMPEKSLLLTLFTAGSDSSVPAGKKSDGVLLVDLLGQERSQFRR